MTAILRRARAVRSGAGVELTFDLCEGEYIDEKKIIISPDAYDALGRPDAGEYSEREFLTVAADAEIYEARNRAVYLLSFGDNNKSAVVRKLTAKGISREAARRAAEELAASGYIDEKGQLRAVAERLAKDKLYGLRRLYPELLKKGFDKKDISEALDEIKEEVDFDAQKRELLRAKFGKAKPSDAAEAAKMRAFLYRYGY